MASSCFFISFIPLNNVTEDNINKAKETDGAQFDLSELSNKVIKCDSFVVPITGTDNPNRIEWKRQRELKDGQDNL